MPGMSRSRRRYFSREDATPLISAVISMKDEPQRGWAKFQKAIQLTPNLDEVDSDGFTALMYAVRLNLPTIIRPLVEAGAAVDHFDEDGNTPFFYACMFRHWDIMKILVELGADPDKQDDDSDGSATALLTAVDCQDAELVDKLLKVGASPNRCSPGGVPPLVLALSHRHRQYDTTILRLLLDAGADVNLSNSEGVTPLMVACHPARRYLEAAQMLINLGATVNRTDTNGRAAIHYCSRTLYNFRCLRALLQAGAQANVTDSEGNTSLSMIVKCIEKSGRLDSAIENLFLKTLTELFRHGADPNIVTCQTTPNYLMSAILCMGKAHDAACILLAAGAEPISLSQYSQYISDRIIVPKRPLELDAPLNRAISCGKLPVANLLIDGLFYTGSNLLALSTYFDNKDSLSCECHSQRHQCPQRQNSRGVTSGHSSEQTDDEAGASSSRRASEDRTGHLQSSPRHKCLMSLRSLGRSASHQSLQTARSYSPSSDRTSSVRTSLDRTASRASSHRPENREAARLRNSEKPQDKKSIARSSSLDTILTPCQSRSRDHTEKEAANTDKPKPVCMTVQRSASGNIPVHVLGASTDKSKPAHRTHQRSASGNIPVPHFQGQSRNNTPGAHDTSDVQVRNVLRMTSNEKVSAREFSRKDLEILELIQKACYTTPTLQQFCRRTIHRALIRGRDRAVLVKSLPIAAKLQRYILFQGLDYDS